MDIQQYLTDIGQIDSDALLNEWHWLLEGRPLIVFRATAMGDLILQDADGRFHLLDMIDGAIRTLAASEPELWTELNDRRARKSILFSFLVRDLRAIGIELRPGECYSPDVPPVLGGTLDGTNLRPCDIVVHASMMGQIHRQVRDMPAGTRIIEVRQIGERKIRLIPEGTSA